MSVICLNCTIQIRDKRTLSSNSKVSLPNVHMCDPSFAPKRAWDEKLLPMSSESRRTEAELTIKLCGGLAIVKCLFALAFRGCVIAFD